MTRTPKPLRPAPASGFGLVELAVSLLLGAVVVAFGYKFFAQQSRLTSVSVVHSKVRYGAQRMLDVLERDVRSAQRLAARRPDVAFGIQPLPHKSFDPVSQDMTRDDEEADAVRLVTHVPSGHRSLRLAADMATPQAPLQVADPSAMRLGSLWLVVSADLELGTSAADLLQVTQVTGSEVHHSSQEGPFNPPEGLSRAYFVPAFLYEAAVVEYGLDRSDPEKPLLMIRRNGGPWAVFSKAVWGFQIHYRVHDGTYQPGVGEPVFETLGPCEADADPTICREPEDADSPPDLLARLYDVKIVVSFRPDVSGGGTPPVDELAVKPVNFHPSLTVVSLDSG